MTRTWTAEDIVQMARGYQAAAVLAAAADLELFAALQGGPAPAGAIAQRLRTDLRGTTILLDALAAMGLLRKHGDRYEAPPEVATALTAGDPGSAPGSVLGIVQHQANCMRRWVRLAWTVRQGRPPEHEASVRGAAADYAAFIQAMDDVNAPVAARTVADLQPLRFRQLLDVGGASGTWTAALLRAGADPSTRAVIFDLPQVEAAARARMDQLGLRDRVQFVAGDFDTDELPGGCDLAWVSAIVHQNSRAQNRELFGRIHRALEPGGRVLVRDIVMQPSRIAPPGGAMFAVNMLVSTDAGGTFTLDELREDLEAAGFRGVRQARHDEGMHAVVEAHQAG